MVNVGTHVSNDLIAEAIYQFLITKGYSDIVMSGKPSGIDFTPNVLLADGTTLRYKFLALFAGSGVPKRRR